MGLLSSWQYREKSKNQREREKSHGVHTVGNDLLKDRSKEFLALGSAEKPRCFRLKRVELVRDSSTQRRVRFNRTYV